ncbi:MAG: DNRLRE domain-containing protein, partial [Chloroflexi bacterium]|nr:DNRLRE domain-containing protein [Chloroflexota bacterium]
MAALKDIKRCQIMECGKFMFKLQKPPKIVISLFAKPARIMFLVALFVLTTMVATTAAQDETPAPDDLPPEVTVLEQVVTPDSVTTVINVTTIKDSFVASNFPNTNYGGFGQLRTGYDSTFTNYGAERILMEFNIGSIPSGAIVNSATFNIYQEAFTGPNPN